MRFTRWDQFLTVEQTNEVLFLLSGEHLSRCAASVEVDEIRALVERRDLVGLCNYSLSYNSRLPADTYRHIRQVLAFFSKRADIDIGVDTQAVAWEKAVEAEALCRETNQLFRKYFRGGFHFPLDVESVFYRAQRKISTILGELPSLEELKLRFGPGATTQVKKKDSSVRRKLAQKFACSYEVTGILPNILTELPLWSGAETDQYKSSHTLSEEYWHSLSPEERREAILKAESRSLTVPVEIHEGRVDFVRKTSKTDRSISVEPMLNTLVQLGIGEYIGDRLRKSGIDLRDQSRNQRLACLGSLTNALATLDLSSASDTISKGLVESLLPLDWWLFLCSIRTGTAETPDGMMQLEKFSSMGNGFTFPLETLIFYGLAEACCDPSDWEGISVYGDDIIVPTYAVPLLKKVLHCSGFILNDSKSFSDGPFRESCGADFISGINIRPCYIKDSLSGASCFVLHNFYVRSGQPELASILLQYVDESLQIWGPDGYGDGHLLGDHKLVPHNRDRGWGGYTFETYTYEHRRAFYKLGADHVFPSYSIYVKEDGGPDWDRDRTVGENLQALDAAVRQKLFHHRFCRGTGSSRPERIDARYVKYKGKWFLEDTLPGVKGYKRIKIYTLG